MDRLAIERSRTPVWLLTIAGFGIAWNAFGIVQLIEFIGRTHASLMMKGMTAAAAEIYDSLPVWMTLAFAFGSVGGMAGSVLLGLRRVAATPVLVASLLGYIALFAGDYAHGVFDAVAGQMTVLLAVVAIAAGLLSVSVLATRTGSRDRIGTAGRARTVQR
jgi:hypothetical protein